METEFLQKRVKNIVSWKFWFSNLLRAGIGGAATALLAKGLLPNTITDFDDLWKVAASAAAVKACMFLEKSPLPSIAENGESPNH